MRTLFSPLMAPIYGGISGVLMFWQAAWHKVFGDARWLGTDWSWVLGIVFLVLTVRAVLIPIFVKQIKSQRAMQALQPKVKALQEKHKGDRETMQKELVELYRSEKANPLMGCLPMFLQVPVFIGLFHVLKHLTPTITSEKSRTLYGWTLGQFDSASHAKLFGAPIAASLRSTAAELEPLGASGATVKLVGVILIAVMITTTFLTSRQMILKTGWAEDPRQRMVQRLMLYGVPLSLLISGAIFPIGVVIYWVTQNVFSLGQQMWVLRKYPPTKMNGNAGAAGQMDQPEVKATDSSGNGAVPPASKALRPKVGTKPVKPKKGGAARP
jgi:YidC/Oxa1 family membrane protein insertase